CPSSSPARPRTSSPSPASCSSSGSWGACAPSPTIRLWTPPMPEYLSPGFVDLQVNGYAGVDYNAAATTPEDVRRSLDAMTATGVTLCLPTIITSSREHFAH